jgi:uncharacterized protein involved in response to NO
MQRLLPVQDDLPAPAARPKLAVSAKGFRPFFLLASALASGIVPLWILILTGAVPEKGYFAPTIWHAHEMVFGFALAVMAGFLLTAVGNWTKRETVVGAPLLALAALWVAGRFAVYFGGALPRGVPALLDLAFTPVLTVILARPLLAARDRHTFIVPTVLVALFAANLVAHLEALGILPAGSGRRACLVAVDIVVFVILAIAGRVFPVFTRNATGVESIRSSRALEALTLAAMALLVGLDTVIADGLAAAVASGAVGLLAVARAWHWRTVRVAKHPLLWILHVGYAWVPLGLVLRAVAAFHPVIPASLATHALTVGATGSLTLGMMARVALGHTGRPLVASHSMSWAFAAVTLAASVRVLGPLLFPSRYLLLLIVAGGLWTAAFLAYFVVYAPILLRPRVDGRAG